MSVSGIFSSSLNSSDSLQNTIRKEFRQLGQDLQSGNLSAAQSDFATFKESCAAERCHVIVGEQQSPYAGIQSTEEGSAIWKSLGGAAGF